MNRHSPSDSGGGAGSENARKVHGTVLTILPSALFRVTLDDGSTVTAGLSTEARRLIVKVVPGDRVEVAISPFDPNRGKITGRMG